MKKLLLASIFLIGFSSVAQEKGDVEFGVNIGFNSSNVTTSDNLQADPKPGFNAGIAADYYFSDRWSIKGKLIYDGKGWEEMGAKFKLSYLTIPVMANWHFGSKRNWYLNFGPYAGFLMNAEETESNTDIKDAFNSTDFGLALGIGVKIPLSDKLKMLIEYDGQGGFSDIFKENEFSAVRNSRASINVGLNFLLK